MSKSHYDAIILLGRSINSDTTIVETDRVRIEKTAELYKSGVADAIIVCGSYGYKATEKPTVTEAEAYARILEELGVPRNAIHLEEESQESLGNILFAKMRILIPQNWRNVLVLPTYNHSTERIAYLLRKILGSDYSWEILRIGESSDLVNTEREAKALKNTTEINDQFQDGDHDAIYQGLLDTHPAYGGTKWTMDELREEMKHE